MTLQDRTLSEDGLPPPPRAGSVLVIACGALAREILALKALNGWSHLDLQCLPAKLHLWPDRIPAAVEAAVAEARPRYARIFVAYADCGTGGLLQARCAALGVEMIAGPHCYSFFDGNAAFEARGDAEMCAFYLTDFLVRQFDAFVWQPMGLDRHPELRDMIFGNYQALIYLAQTDDPALDRLAQDAPPGSASPIAGASPATAISPPRSPRSDGAAARHRVLAGAGACGRLGLTAGREVASRIAAGFQPLSSPRSSSPATGRTVSKPARRKITRSARSSRPRARRRRSG